MAFSVTLYPFDKRVNSTKRPNAGAGTLVTSCELKSSCSVLQPTLTFTDGVFKANDQIYAPTRYTYAYIPDFGRYYWITNWIWSDGIWIASLSCDVLASFKTEIGASSQYILRSATRFNPDIVDTKYLTYYDSSVSMSDDVSSQSSIWSTNINATTPANGFFIIGIVNNDTAAVGATSYYAMAGAVMRKLISKLMAAPTWLNITDATLTADLQKLMFNPMQYITTLMWIPTGLTGYSSMIPIHSIPFGWWTIDLDNTDNVYRLEGAMFQTMNPTITIPRHPQSATAKYLDLAPYSQYSVTFEPFGTFSLDPTKIYGAFGLRLQVVLDYITGRARLGVWAQYHDVSDPSVTVESSEIYTTIAQVGIPISVGEITIDRSSITSLGTWAGAFGYSMLQNHGDLIDKAIETVSSFASTPSSTYVNKVTDAIKANPWKAAGAVFLGGGTMLLSEKMKEGGGSASFGEPVTSESSAKEIMATIKQDVGSMMNAVVGSSGTCTSQGLTGGFASYALPIRCRIFYCARVAENNARWGRPLCEIDTISNHSGYILCATGEVECNASKAEREDIASYLTGGFYYE